MTGTSPLVITISRQLGSGGAYVGQMLAKRSGLFYADREIICKAAEQLSALEGVLEAREERVHSFWQSFLESFAFVVPETYTPPIVAPTDRQLFHTESKIIKTIAKEGSAVIIGRCASQILCDHPNHVSVFLHADTAFRKRRMQELYKVTEDVAERMIRKSDRERSQYIYVFTGSDWNDLTQYDLTLDTGRLEIDKCVDLVLKFVELGRFCDCPRH